MRSSNSSPIFNSDEDFDLNQAILASLQNNQNTQPQFVPVQTTTTSTYIPVPQRNVTGTQQQTTPTNFTSQRLPLPRVPINFNIPNITSPNITSPAITVPTTLPQIPVVQGQTLPQITNPYYGPRSPTLPQPIIPISTRPFYSPRNVGSNTIESFYAPLNTTISRPNVPIPNSVTPNLGTQNIPRYNIITPKLDSQQTRNIPPLTTITTKSTTTTTTTPSNYFPPLQTVQLSPREPLALPARYPIDLSQNSQISILPEKLSRDEEENRLAVAMWTSLQESPTQNYNNIDDDIDELFLQEAIAQSTRAVEQARLATQHVRRIIPNSPILSPRSSKILEDRQLREQQDREYEYVLRMDREAVENARIAAEAAEKAALAAEDATKKLQKAKLEELKKKESLLPPILKYPPETTDVQNLYILAFKLPNGSRINHSFHRDEPLSSIIQQLQFDLKYPGHLNLTLPPNTAITCDPRTSISSCGIPNKNLIFVTYP